MMKITVITDIPSPYQVELFNAVARQNREFRAVYVRRQDPSRQWGAQKLEHEHTYLEELSLADEKAVVEDPELLVFSFYGTPQVQRMMAARARSGKAWCFWGERLGFRHSGILGKLYRRWRLRILQHSRAPIWGIGQWALESYINEFGTRRHYHNVPYFSDLSRFCVPAKEKSSESTKRIFLFSGSFIERKGVDVLAEAFLRVAADFPHCHLHLLGDGPLRGHLEAALSPLGERVRFLGFRDWDELPAAYAEADVLCAPSRHDGWALVVPEGLAAGLPVISTDRTGAAQDLIRDGENGWMTRAGDPTALEKALRSAAALSTDELTCMSEAARASALNHSLASGAERFLEAARASIINKS